MPIFLPLYSKTIFDIAIKYVGIYLNMIYRTLSPDTLHHVFAVMYMFKKSYDSYLRCLRN